MNKNNKLLSENTLKHTNKSESIYHCIQPLPPNHPHSSSYFLLFFFDPTFFFDAVFFFDALFFFVAVFLFVTAFFFELAYFFEELFFLDTVFFFDAVFFLEDFFFFDPLFFLEDVFFFEATFFFGFTALGNTPILNLCADCPSFKTPDSIPFLIAALKYALND